MQPPTIDVDTESNLVVRLLVDGSEVDQNTLGPLYTFTLPPLADDSYEITATGKDLAGNVGVSAALTIHVDTTHRR